MKKTIKLTESDLTRLVKQIIIESAEGIDDFINTISNKYEISEELKSEILNTIESSGCKKISIKPIKMGDAVSLVDQVVLHPNVLRYGLPKFLFILFHELAHQFQFRKYGEEKMLELYLEEISIKDAAEYMFGVEKVADEFGMRKVSTLKRKGLINFSDGQVNKSYAGFTPSRFEYMIKEFRKELKLAKIDNPKKISEFLYNMIKIEM